MTIQTKESSVHKVLEKLGIARENKGSSTGKQWFSSGDWIDVLSPVDGKLMAKIQTTSEADYDKVIDAATAAFYQWKKVPAPQRGEIVRQLADSLRANKTALGELVSYEMGKSFQEGLGEVQEMIDICDFAVG